MLPIRISSDTANQVGDVFNAERKSGLQCGTLSTVHIMAKNCNTEFTFSPVKIVSVLYPASVIYKNNIFYSARR